MRKEKRERKEGKCYFSPRLGGERQLGRSFFLSIPLCLARVRSAPPACTFPSFCLPRPIRCRVPDELPPVDETEKKTSRLEKSKRRRPEASEHDGAASTEPDHDNYRPTDKDWLVGGPPNVLLQLDETRVS